MYMEVGRKKLNLNRFVRFCWVFVGFVRIVRFVRFVGTVGNCSGQSPFRMNKLWAVKRIYGLILIGKMYRAGVLLLFVSLVVS